MLERYRRLFEGIFIAVGSRIPIGPNTLTLLALVPAAAALLSALWGHAMYVGPLIAASSMLDALDGAVARARGSASRRGAFLDSAVDRYVDFLSFMALGIMGFLWLAIAGLLGAYMTSYARARAEGLGVEVRGVGVLERAERQTAIIAIAVIYALTGSSEVLLWGLMALAAAANATAVHRIIYIFRILR